MMRIFSDNQNQKNCILAMKDYVLFLNKGYSKKSIHKLVGDRYKLSKILRKVLFRGILPTDKANDNVSKLIRGDLPKNENLSIDGYNIFFTILNYRLGRPLFISNDGLVRDIGDLYGKIYNNDLLREVMVFLLKFVNQLNFKKVTIYIDIPVTKSEIHADFIESLFREYEINGECKRIKSADTALKKMKHGLIATSDSEVIHHSKTEVLDLARLFLEKNYQATFIDLRDLLNEI